MNQDREWYDWYYAESMMSKGEYSKEPEQSVYYDLLNYIDSMLLKDEKIADFGCGVGQFAKLLISRGKTYILGVDFSKTAIHYAQLNNPSKMRNFLCADLLNAIIVPHYDTAILTEVLEHVEQDKEILMKIPSGRRVIFSVPDFDSTSHVRVFKDVQEAINRYDGILKINTAKHFNIYGSNIFLYDSVKV